MSFLGLRQSLGPLSGLGSIAFNNGVRSLHTAPTLFGKGFMKDAIAKRNKKDEKRGFDPSLRPIEVYARRRQIKYSPWKLNQVARQIRRLPIDEAIRQMEFSTKKVALDVRLVLKSARANAASQTTVEDPSKMYVEESWVGKGKYGKGMRKKGKGRGYQSDRPFSHYYVKLREGPPPSSKRPASEGKVYHSRRLQDRLERRPPKILSSL